ncbi:uncharacterized protein LOC115936872 isoform X2 [Leptonychotes weddellii]|uniref:Uncharacterized protein LOC115936872 isoform X2 n=1 Tax=Leptonychotes weddellii TaxID=9713 RepID=A0A7F8PXZ4_LEPWE|nr:uncharacterized protein LOC115936872 isoform X2 [Leptonychotes weddellii]
MDFSCAHPPEPAVHNHVLGSCLHTSAHSAPPLERPSLSLCQSSACRAGSVVVPRCRGTAEALQITISSTLRAGRPDSYLQSFLSLQQSFLCCTFVIALGGGCFLLTALRLERDQARARQPGTGTPSPPTSARLGAEPHRSGEHGPPPEPADLLICSFIQKWSLPTPPPTMCQMQGGEHLGCSRR